MTVLLRHTCPNRSMFLIQDSHDGQLRAASAQEIGPGCRQYGRTYDEWILLPEGEYEVPASYDPNDDEAPAVRDSRQPHLFLTRVYPDRLVLRAYGNHNGIRWHLREEVEPGWRIFGRTYEEWAALPSGGYAIPDNYNPDEDYAPPGVGIPE